MGAGLSNYEAPKLRSEYLLGLLEQEGRQAPLESGASPSSRLSKDEPIDEGPLTFDVPPAVASCDSDQILGGVFLATWGDLWAQPSGPPS